MLNSFLSQCHRLFLPSPQRNRRGVSQRLADYADLRTSEPLEVRSLLAAQLVSLAADMPQVATGSTVDVDINYEINGTAANPPNGLSIQIHYDSSKLTFDSATGLMLHVNTNFISSLTPTPTPENVSDGDSDTDTIVELIWFNAIGGWPTGTALPAELATLRFTAASDVGDTSLHVTRTIDPNFTFESVSSTIEVTPETFVVNSSDDTPTSGELTLREAVVLANANPNLNIIQFAASVTSVQLTGASLTLSSDIMIEGSGADRLSISAPGTNRLFVVDAGRNVEIVGVKLDGAGTGGGITNNGSLLLDNVAIVNSTTTTDGGAIRSSGTLRLRNTELSGNHSDANGGALSNMGTATLVNTTISGNSANGNGGGISSSGPTTLRNVTVTGNNASNDNAGGETGGGLFRSAGTFTVRNSIVVGNTAAGASSEVSGTINAASSLTSGTVAQILNTTLAANGGTTRSHALIAGGPAENSGTNSDAIDIDGAALLFDQRGRTRFFGSTVDMGAVEVSPTPGFTVTQSGGSSVVSETGTTDSITLVLTAPPVSSVVLNIASADTGEVAVGFASVTFSPGNWNVAQTVPLTGVDDAVADGNQTTVVTVSVDQLNSDVTFRSLANRTISVTTTDDEAAGGLPGDVDGDSDFDANDTFLIQLIALAGSNSQIDQSKGASSRTAAEIRAGVAQLQSVGDVDGDGDFDANDSFLMQLIKLAGSNSQIDLSKGASPLTAAQIRTNVDNLGRNSGASFGPTNVGTPARLMAALSGFDDLLLVPMTPNPETASTDSVLTEFRSWIDAVS